MSTTVTYIEQHLIYYLKEAIIVPSFQPKNPDIVKESTPPENYYCQTLP